MFCKRCGRDNVILGLTVSRPSELALEVFNEMAEAGELNKWVVYLMSPDVQDVNDTADYEYTNDGSLQIDPAAVAEFAQDDFIRYIRSRNYGRVAQSRIRIGGTVDDIGKSEFVQLFAATLGGGTLYLDVEEGAVNEAGEKKYRKSLIWTDVAKKKSQFAPTSLIIVLAAIVYMLAAGTEDVLVKFLIRLTSAFVIFGVAAFIESKCMQLEKERYLPYPEEWAKFRKKKMIGYGIAAAFMLYVIASSLVTYFRYYA